MAYSVAIVAIARLENQYINEWISYHHGLGFDHFYVYDNSCGNEVRIDKVLTEDNAKVTTIVPCYNKTSYQKAAYNDAYQKFNSKHDYMMFIDIDEFFTLMKHATVSEYIEFLNSKCPGFQSCRINWEMYDDNNAITRDLSIPVHQFFKQKSSTKDGVAANKSSKCLIKCKIKGMYFDHVHYSKIRLGVLKTCNGNGDRVFPKSQMIQPIKYDYAKIRHYATKTISEYIAQKLKRGDADGFIVRTINNRFFVYSKKTPEKLSYYNKHKGSSANGMFQFG